jgi:hypothetical protein
MLDDSRLIASSASDEDIRLPHGFELFQDC